MLQTAFLGVVNLSIAATLAGAAVVGIRFLLKNRIPRWVPGLLWAVVLLRLLLPGLPAAPASAFSVLDRPAAQARGEYSSSLTFVAESGVTVAYPALDAGSGPVLAAPTPPEFILSHIWAWGFCLLTLYSLGAYLLLARRARGAAPVPWQGSSPAPDLGRARLLCLDGIRGPMLCGILSPKILVPPAFFALPEEHRRMILAHELAHLRRGDNVLKLVWTLTLYLHWMNPFVWMFYRLFVTDMEAACDEAALQGAGQVQRAAYAALLLDMTALARGPFAGGFLAFGESALSQRVKSILAGRRTTALTLLLSAAVVLGLAGAFLTNPVPRLPAGDAVTAGPALPGPAPADPAPTVGEDLPQEPAPPVSQPAAPAEEEPRVAIREGNPPALALDWDQVETVHLFSQSNTFAALGLSDRRAVVAALNALDGSDPGDAPIPPSALRIQVRLRTGGKLEYYCGKALLVADGRSYPLGDDALYRRAAGLLDRYPRQGAGWLGHMNPYRILRAEVREGDRVRELTQASRSSRELLLTLAADLQDIAVAPESYAAFAAGDRAGVLAQPQITLTLTFDSGVVYTISLDESRMAVESSDMDFGTLYGLADPAAALGAVRAWAAP